MFRSPFRWCCVNFSVISLINLSCSVFTVKHVQGEMSAKSSHGESIDVMVASDDEIKTILFKYGVHYNISSVIDLLKHPETHKEETVQILLRKYEELQQRAPKFLSLSKFRHPIISIDGFFTHGRTKVAKMVATALYGRRILLPTKHITRLRTYFNNPLIKKHYYSLSKYIGAHLAMIYCRSAPVILERYWHDQTGYVLAKTFEGLIPENSSVYEFPTDLLVPDKMFFVNGVLNQRIYNETSAAFYTPTELSAKIVEIYKRMRRPKLIEIGPPSLPTPMVEKIMKIMDNIKNNFLPKPRIRPVWYN